MAKRRRKHPILSDEALRLVSARFRTLGDQSRLRVLNMLMQGESSVQELVDMGSTAVKVWYLRPSPERRDELDARLMQIGEETRAAGLDLIVHATSLREAKQALRAGAVLLVHSVEDQPVDWILTENGPTQPNRS